MKVLNQKSNETSFKSLLSQMRKHLELEARVNLGLLKSIKKASHKPVKEVYQPHPVQKLCNFPSLQPKQNKRYNTYLVKIQMIHLK